MTYKVWDIETTIRERFKRKASPFGAGNWVVTHGWKAKGGAPTEQRFGDTPPADGWLVPILEGTSLLVGFNIKFDLLHAITSYPKNLEAWMDWVAKGGQVWDCQLAEYLLEGMGQKDHMLSLDEVAPRYGGNLKFDEIKALWEAGVDTHLIEPKLLTRYLIGGEDERGEFQKGDLENTETVFLGQLTRARENDQLRSILLNMGALVATTEKERNGMYVDVGRATTLMEELKVVVAELNLALTQYVPADLPFEFKWTSRHHKSALIFGGKVRYDRREFQLRDGTYTFVEGHHEQAYVQKEEVHYVLQDGSTYECSWWEHCRDTEWQGDPPEGKDRVLFAGGKNKGEPKTKKVKVPDLTKPKSRIGEDWYTFPGYTKAKPAWETSEPGVYSVNDEIIEELGVRGIPFLAALAKFTKLTKDLGTYYLSVGTDGKQKGMLALVGEDGIIHHKINHTSTVTGRFSSSDPNLQNVPKGKNSQIKTVFVSRFEDGKIIQSDFSSLEVYIQAILTGCRQLIADLKAGLDMHVKRLALKEGISYEECLEKCKGNAAKGILAIKEWDDKRTGAKVFSFQRAYGAGAAKIAASTGMAVEDVEALILAEEQEYPEIAAYYDDLAEKLKARRKPTGRAVPHPEVRGVMCHIGEATYRTPDGKLYLYQEYPAPEFVVKRGTFANFSPTQIKNYVVQGEGGEWAKAAEWLAVRAFYARRNFNHRALLVNQVHDAQYADAAPEAAFEAAALLHACMEAASDFMEWYFSWPIPVPVPSDTTWGASMMDEEKIPGVLERAASYRAELRRDYMGGYTPTFQ